MVMSSSNTYKKKNYKGYHPYHGNEGSGMYDPNEPDKKTTGYNVKVGKPTYFGKPNSNKTYLPQKEEIPKEKVQEILNVKAQSDDELKKKLDTTNELLLMMVDKLSSLESELSKLNLSVSTPQKS